MGIVQFKRFCKNPSSITSIKRKLQISIFKTHSLGQEHYYMRMMNDSTYIVCEKFFSGYVNNKLLKEWND